MKLTRPYQWLILGLAGFLMVVFCYYQLMLKPINVEIVQLQSTLDQKNKDLEEAKKTVTKYVEFKKREDSVQRELEWLQSRIPKSIDKIKLMENVNLVQKNSDVVTTSFQFASGNVARDSWVEIPITIRFNTNYKGLLNFLYQVSVSSQLLTVRDIVIMPYVDSSRPEFTITTQLTICGIQGKS